MGNHSDPVRALVGDRDATSEICTVYGARLRAYFFRHGLATRGVDDSLQEIWHNRP